MTAQRLVENSILTNQTAVVDEMLKENLLPEEYIYPFLGDIMEWWLIDDWLAEQLKAENQVIIEEYGCCWWGRLSSGQAICMDDVIRKIAGEWFTPCISLIRKHKLQRLGALQFIKESATSNFCFYAGVKSIIGCNR